MSSGKTFVRPLISVVLIATTVLGLSNVYSDNTAELKMAEELACGSTPCSARLVQLERSVIAQTMVFQTAALDSQGNPKPSTSGTKRVRCQKEFIFVGDYSCTLQSSD